MSLTQGFPNVFGENQQTNSVLHNLDNESKKTYTDINTIMAADGHAHTGDGSDGAVIDADSLNVIPIPASIAQGDIIYRGASAFERLPAGTSGQILKTQGASANPVWVDPPGNPTGTIISVLSKNTPVGYLKVNGAAISRTTYANLVSNTFITIPTTGNKTSGSAIITNIPTTVDMAIGMAVEGAGIPDGATITAINSLTSITLSASLTATAVSGALTVFPYGNGDGSTTVNLPDLRGEHLRAFDDSRNADSTGFTLATTSGSNVISSIPYTGFMFVGMPLSGAGIPVGATVATITGATAITISANATATSTKLIIFTGRRFGSFESDDLRAHKHAPLSPATFFFAHKTDAGSGGYGGGSLADCATTADTGGAETRGRNYAISVYIKY